MSYWTDTARPNLTSFFKNRWSFFIDHFWDVVFWCGVSAVVGHLV